MSEVGSKKAKHNSASPFGLVYHPKERRIIERRIAKERGELKLQMTEPSQQQVVLPAALVDLAMDATAFGLLTEKRIPKGSIIELVFEGQEMNGALQVEVMWCNELPVTGNVIKIADPERRWRLGVRMTKNGEITEEQKKLIAAIMTKL